jgi:hypothetical protein
MTANARVKNRCINRVRTLHKHDLPTGNCGIDKIGM